MYFKSLELYGFKSFAEKAKLVFEPGVTAIVGPNGCGKSNIADAIRWVLGEQSAKTLRGARMEDLIFSGTEEKEPLNMCEVSFTLDNSERFLPIDFDEVTISRKLFRSGESSYSINKTEVRLKEIQELISGTGLGAESYSFIAQGKIDSLLSSKPEERRFLFEEASGITKYKSKKKEALRKLEQTEQNLNRIADIISEVSRQIRSVERQAKKAMVYQEYFDQLKNLELDVAQHNICALDAQKSDVASKAEQEKAKQQTIAGEIVQIESQLKQLRHTCSALETQITQVNAQISAIDMEATTSYNKIALNRERVIELKARQEVLSRQTEQSVKKIEELETGIISLQDSCNALTAELSQQEKVLLEREETLKGVASSIRESTHCIDSSKAALLDISAQEAQAKNALMKITADLHSGSTRARRLTIEKEKTQEMMSSIEGNLKKAQQDLARQKVLVEEGISSRDSTKSSIATLNQHIETLTQECEGHKTRVSVLESRLAVLVEAQRSHEGFSRGPKAILQMKDALSGLISPEEGVSYPEVHPEKIYGPVSHLIEVQGGREVVVETALADVAQAIVVEDRDTVERLLAYLKERDLGRAHFISMDRSFTAPEVPQSLQEYIIGRFSEFVRYDNRFAPVFNPLFQRFLYVRDAARDCEIPDDVVIATDRGVVVREKIIEGGATELSEVTGLIGRQQKIEHMQQEISAAIQERDRIEKELAESKDRIRSLSMELEGLEAQLKQAEIQVAQRQSEFDSINNEYVKIREELSVIELELADVTEELESLRQRESQYRSQVEVMESQYQELTQRINEHELLIKEKTQEKENLLIEIEQVRGEANTLRERCEVRNKECARFKQELCDERTRHDENTNERVYITQKTQELSGEEEALAEKVRVLEHQKTETVTRLDELTATKDRSLTQINDIEGGLVVLKGQAETVAASFNTLQVKLTELGFERRSIVDRVAQLYQVQIDQMRRNIEGMDVGAACNDIEILRSKVDKLGAVNLVAIEEHKELEERFQFLTTQKDDLQRAKDDLMKAIDQINKTTKKLFLETFDKIEAEFAKYFKLLFNGGSARLVLTDNADVLEAGIEIEARPPGKTLQSVNLLSGGEKALSAVALLFAIFKIKPSPFCILDEIDAPLDEANVDRFLLLLKEFLETSQFIIITHNKKTITVADVMYGITMERSGLSKIVSVKFAKRGTKTDAVTVSSPADYPATAQG
ncbi:MAG: chromosome segregation protein SMC [Candidatus Omnitrophica bacterium]|nr:chromosome segregation protein SMC [Candidatus Omnitrophota bacterium]